MIEKQRYRIRTRSQPWIRISAVCYLRHAFVLPFRSSKRQTLLPHKMTAFVENMVATYEMSAVTVPEDAMLKDAELVRPLLKNTQLESRPLQIAYDANKDRWDPSSFHRGVDAKGATIIIAREVKEGRLFGGYNPKGFCSFGGSRPSLAAFLFYEQTTGGKFHKLQKLKDGMLSCARDDANFGISFGINDLVIGLQSGNERLATSNLGEYFECGPENLKSLFGQETATELVDLKVLVGCYEDGEVIPYTGEVLDSFQFANNGLSESIFLN
jgi:hypothetical protein